MFQIHWKTPMQNFSKFQKCFNYKDNVLVQNVLKFGNQQVKGSSFTDYLNFHWHEKNEIFMHTLNLPVTKISNFDQVLKYV